MKSAAEVINVLNRILESDGTARYELIKYFQSEAWADDSDVDESIDDTVYEIAYDMDFYQPNKAWRKQQPSLYGDERLDEMLKEWIYKIEVKVNE
ncbi:MAG: hypothetical protein V4577_18545 [Bacteroidota bacterium]